MLSGKTLEAPIGAIVNIENGEINGVVNGTDIQEIINMIVEEE